MNFFVDPGPALQMEAKSSPIGRQKDKDCILTTFELLVLELLRCTSSELLFAANIFKPP